MTLQGNGYGITRSTVKVGGGGPRTKEDYENLSLYQVFGRNMKKECNLLDQHILQDICI